MNGIHVLAVAVALTITGPHWHLDVSIQTAVPIARLQSIGVAAMTLPGVTLYDPADAGMVTPEGLTLWQHELRHWRQERALGPWFWIAYAASDGAAFEPYRHTGPLVPLVPSGPVEWTGWAGAWTPPSDMLDNYPLIRIGDAGIQILPGY